MRLFVALEVPAAVREAVRRRVGELKSRFPRARWVPSENLHLTLVFLGEVDPGRIPGLHRALAPTFAARAPFPARLAGGGTFPPQRPARVAWIGFEGGPGLVELQREVEEAVTREMGVEAEDRPFHPHLTLARARLPWPRRAAERWSEALSGRIGEPFEVHRGVLLKSHLSPGGARYGLVESYPLEEAR